MGHIFISYSHKDLSYVHNLAEALAKEGFKIWIDDRIHYGSEWPRVVTTNLDMSDGVIVVLSNNSYESDMVQNEVTRAREKKKPIFTLLLDGENWLIVQAKQFVDVRDGSLPKENFYKRLTSVTPRDKPIPTPPSPSEESKPTPAGWSDNSTYTKPVTVVEKKNAQDKKPASKFDFRLLGILLSATVLLILILGLYGINYFANLFATSQPHLVADTFAPPPTPISTMISEKDGMNLIYVPAGNFLMGSTDSDPNAQAEEKPQHTVYLDSFWIDQTDVTNAMYAKCVSAGLCKRPFDVSSATRSSYYGNSQFDNYPVINVSWNMANTYCQWVGSQLPTEAQWEKAARGMDGRVYPWGNNTPNTDLLNYNNKVGDTTEVGKYPNGASPYGAFDMAGDVWQWTADWFNPTYYQSSPSSNPLVLTQTHRAQNFLVWVLCCGVAPGTIMVPMFELLTAIRTYRLIPRFRTTSLVFVVHVALNDSVIFLLANL